MAAINPLGWVSDSSCVLQLLSICFSVTFMLSTSFPARNESGATVFLEKNVYMRESVADRSKEAVVPPTEALNDFQRFTGTKQESKLENETLTMMNTSICGAQDKGSHSTTIRKKRYVLQGSKWTRMPITFRVSKYSKRLKDPVKISAVFTRAFKVWSDVSSLQFEEKTRGRVDIDIRFEVGNHGDNTIFKGKGGKLAHAFFPQFGGDVHFDDDEDWTMDETGGTSLFHVAAHEFGHALGLGHSEVKKAVMYAKYESSESLFELQDDDIKAIQDVYGSPDNPVIEEPGPDTSSAVDMCTSATIDAATMVQNGDTYFFKGNFYWKIQVDTVVAGYPRRIRDDWGGLEGHLDAAFTWSSGKTFFIKGGKYWRFTNQIMDLGFPKSLSIGFEGIPEAPDAAFVWSGNGNTYFFKGERYWLYDSRSDPPVSNEYPKLIRNWRGLPNKIDAAFQWENQRTYFFKGNQYYRFNDDEFKVESADPPYPRFISTSWFRCSSSS